jgi:DNA-binding NarL/FixJ family response regulator
MNTAKIILIEDNPEYRRVIKRALDLAPGMELVAKYGTAEQALRDLESSPQLRKADLVLLDLRLPKISGLEALPWIKRSCPDIKVIVLTQSGDPQDILEAIRQGVAGYLLKSSTVQQIRDGIEAVVNGGSSLDTSVASLILETLQKNLAPRGQPPGLSEREHDVLVLLSEGLVKKEIADRLEISLHTVATHVRHIYEKLGVINAPGAVSVAFRKGLLHVNRPGNGESPRESGS